LVSAISLIDHANGLLTYPIAHGDDASLHDTRLAELPQPVVEATLVGQVTVLDSLEAFPDFQRLYELPARRGLVLAPIVGQQQTQGVITLITADRPRYTVDQLESLKALANQTAIAIDNALAYQELQAALAERERTQQALIRSESLAAVGQLVAGVAHELNNPLASVSSLVQSALETIGLPYFPSQESTATLPIIRPDKLKVLSLTEMVELTEDLAFCLKELRRAKGIVSSLLDLSRQSSSYTEEVSLTTVCQDALRILYNKLKSLPIEIIENYADDLPLVRGNFANLGQVTLNIVENAAEAFEKKPGRIEVGTCYDPARKRVCLYVTDNGPGVSADALPNIFHPFFTTKRVGVGTGLGLYISYEIVKKHGGEIVVETAAGQGTTFRVELPLQASPDQ
jgi:signal transduction histidine kinase